MKSLAVFLAVAFFSIGGAEAQSLKLSAKDSREVQDCFKSKSGKYDSFSSCIGVVANPCLETREGQSAAGETVCFQREHLVWDDILNESYRRLQAKLDDGQKRGLRDAQRAWIEARKLQCDFYRDLVRRPDAGSYVASCLNTETAQRAVYLIGLLNF